MALEDLTKKIVRDAEEAAELVRASARRSAEALEHDAVRREKESRARFARETEELLAKEKEFASERARRDAHVVLEGVRRTCLDDVFTNAEKALVACDAETYRAFVRTALACIAKDLPDVRVFYTPASRRELLEEEVRAAGGTASVETRDDMLGGFIAIGDACEYDMRFQKLVLHAKHACEPEIARLLFSA